MIRCMPLPTSHTMNLKSLHCYQSAINPSALCSGLMSIRWIRHYSGHLCACVSSPLSGIHTMKLTSIVFISFMLCLSHPTVCALWCSLAFFAISLCLLAFALLQPCRDYMGSPNTVHLGNQIDRAWQFDLCLLLHPRTTHHPPRQPLRSSPPIVSMVSRLSPRPMHVELNGSTSWKLTGIQPRADTRLGLIFATRPSRPSQFTCELCSCAFASAFTTRSNLLTKVSSGGHEKHQEKPHSCSNYTTCTKVQDNLAILQGLVFEVHKEVDDLHFRLEVLDIKGTQILQMLSSLHGSCHPS
jgi:hypothetical protein